MEIEYRWFTIEQCQSLTLNTDPSSEIEGILKIALKSAQNTIPKDPIALLALSGKIVAGHILFTYGHISTPEETIRISAAQNLQTNTKFRGQGVGTALISKSLDISIPCFYTGISGQAMPLYERLGFSFIDQSPIYQMPTTPMGILREWRNRSGRLTKSKRQRFQSIKTLNKILNVRRTATRRAARSTLTMLKKDSAFSTADELMNIRHRHFQIPWDKIAMRESANGECLKFELLAFKNTNVKNQPTHFVTVYRQKDHVRLPRTSKQLDLTVGIVNEIYPPPETLEIAIDIFSKLTANAKAMGFDNLSFCAMTPILEKACQTMELNTYHSKSIAIQPIGLDKDTASSVLKPDNWWCRAMNEDFLEEAR